MIKEPRCIEEANLSTAWAKAFVALARAGVGEIVPLVVTTTGFEQSIAIEDPAIREALDVALIAEGRHSCRTVASTIFPISLWNPSESARALFERYHKILRRLHGHRSNQYGLYFERMIAFQPEGSSKEPVNQLAHVLETYRKGNHRRSALQLSIFDPTRDHTNQRRRGFPCLHQVAFSPMGEGNRGLSVTGFYATQNLFERAYGNYLGLSELGRFVAHELGLELTRMTCIAAVAERGQVSRARAREMVRKLEPLLRDHANPGEDQMVSGRTQNGK